MISVVSGVVAYTVPALAGSGRVAPSTMLLYDLFSPFIYFGCLLATSIWTLYVARAERFRWFILGALGIGIVVLHTGFLGTTKRNERFLDVFSKRVVSEVGLEALMAFYSNVEHEIASGARLDAPIRPNEVPESISGLYSHRRAYGYADFSDAELQRLRVFWGGPSYRWGIEVLFGRAPHGGVEKLIEREIGEGIRCFLAK